MRGKVGHDERNEKEAYEILVLSRRDILCHAVENPYQQHCAPLVELFQLLSEGAVEWLKVKQIAKLENCELKL